MPASAWFSLWARVYGYLKGHHNTMQYETLGNTCSENATERSWLLRCSMGTRGAVYARLRQRPADWLRLIPKRLRYKRLCVLVTTVLAVCANDAAARDAVPTEPSIVEVQQALATGRFDVRALERHYETRINAIDRAGARISSVLEINPDAAQIAAALDTGADQGARARRAQQQRLFGIPILLKDNIDTGDRMQTTAGSLALLGSKPPRDAFIVRRLSQAGALILGKTNLSEWANFRSTHSTSGWSGRGGQTRNPYALNRNPCGSS